MRIGIGTWIAGGASGIGGLVSQLAYLLRATFTRADTGALANGTMLNSAALGVESGSLTVVDTSTGTVEVLGNQLKMVGSGAWNTTGVYSGAVTRTIGKGLLCTVNPTASSQFGPAISFNSVQNVTIANISSKAPYFGLSASIYAQDPSTGIAVGTYSAATDHQTAIVLGGYDVNGVPYKSGDTKANFTYGSNIFVKGGIYTNWTLLWKDMAGNNATVYASTPIHGATATIDNLRIPDSDLSAVLQPTVLDTFTDTNGTALTAHTSDVGAGSWSALVGTFDIQSNQARAVTLGTTAYGAQTAAVVRSMGISDCILEAIIPSISNDRFILFRVTDIDNWWMATVYGTTLALAECTANTLTYRATTAITQTIGGKITVILDGTTISAFYNGANKITYTSSVRQTVTTHGFGVWAGGTTMDNFAVFPRTSATYESQFGGV